VAIDSRGPDRRRELRLHRAGTCRTAPRQVVSGTVGELPFPTRTIYSIAIDSQDRIVAAGEAPNPAYRAVWWFAVGGSGERSPGIPRSLGWLRADPDRRQK